jgi:hypothetical protein
VLRLVRSVATVALAGSVYPHTVAPMAATAATAPPAIQPRRVVGPAHRHGLRTHSTPIRYPHSLVAAAPGRLLSVGLGPLTRL